MRGAVLAILLVAGCGGSIYTTGRETLTGVDYAIQATEKGLDVYDDTHTEELVQQAKAECAKRPSTTADATVACQHAVGDPLLDSYKAKRDLARKALRGMWVAIGAAAAGITIAELSHAGAAAIGAILDNVRAPLKVAVGYLGDIGFAPTALTTLAGVL